MTYQVIARKWRPQTFEEVTGQEAITRTLRNAIEHDRLHHAYLFSGARGVGKTTTARLLAKAINCHRAEGPTPSPCRSDDPDACASCQEVAEGRSIDVLEIDAASNTGVDNVRDAIINTVGVRPARDRYKVFIIDEVHMLSGAAFNALLKTLEEPPPSVLFIMATTESHKVPDTILSRCQQFEFRTITTPKIVERLRLIADAEGVKISDEALREIARAGEGSMRDSQSAFDQVISFSEGKIGTADVETALGIAGGELRSRVMRAVAGQSPAEAIAVVDDLVMRGHDLRNFCRDLLAHLRDLLVIKVTGDGAPDASDAERRELALEAESFAESDLVRFFHSLTETEKHLRESVHPRYQLEIGLVKLVEMRRLAPLTQIIERLNALEEALRAGAAPAAPSGSTPAPTTSAPKGSVQHGGGGRGGHSFAADAHDDGTRPNVPSAPLRNGAPLPVVLTPNSPAPGLKLVPPVAGGHADAPPFPLTNEGGTSDGASAGGAAFKGDSMVGNGGTSGAAAGGDFFEPPPPPPLFGVSEDRVGAPVALVPNDQPQHERPAPEAPEAADEVSRIKRALDQRKKPLLATALDGARRVAVEGDELYVEFAPEGKHLRATLSKPENVRSLREACRDVLGRETGVRIVVREPGEEDAAPLTERDRERLEQQRLREMVENHPVVRQVLQKFRGEIVEVRRVDAERQ